MAATTGFDVSLLQEYIKEVSPSILSASYFSKTYSNYFDIRSFVKGKQKLNYFDTELELVNDGCGWSGDNMEVNFTQREIDVVPVKSEGGFCIKLLEDKWLGQLMRQGQTRDVYPFQNFIEADFKMKLSKLNENIIWNGVYSGSTGTSLDLLDGVLQALRDASGTTITGVTSGTTTQANVAQKIEEICLLFPAAIKEKQLVIFTSIANFQAYILHLYKQNYYHFNDGVQSLTFEVQVPFMPNVKVVAVESLGDKFVGTVTGNLIMAVDAPAELQSIESNYDWKQNELDYRIVYKLGTQVYFPQYCVVSTGL